jgi:predicted  nucleic acid-binding Zn-ribbon protein
VFFQPFHPSFFKDSDLSGQILFQAVQTKLDRALGEKSTLEAELHDLLAQKMEAEERLEAAEQRSKLVQSNLKEQFESKLLSFLGNVKHTN